MWALGLSLLEIVAGKQPFANMTSLQTMTAIRAWMPTIPANSKISNDMKELITHLYVFCLFRKLILVCFLFNSCRLKRNVDERPKTYLEILEIPSIGNITEQPSDEEKAFVTNILDNIRRSNE